MKIADVDTAELERIEVRAIQGLYPEAHQALENWGRWSYWGDIGRPKDARNHQFDEAQKSKFDDFGEEKEYDAAERYQPNIVIVRAERVEEEPYDEKAALVLDARIHGPGGLPDYLKSIIKAAYYWREIPEDQFHLHCNPPCQPSTFRERLEDCLIFVARYV